jgi:hypothetical protein
MTILFDLEPSRRYHGFSTIGGIVAVALLVSIRALFQQRYPIQVTPAQLEEGSR